MRKLNKGLDGPGGGVRDCWAAPAQDQGGTGALEFTAFVSPTAAKPEPVRDFTFYLRVTKSFERHQALRSKRRTAPRIGRNSSPP